MNAEHVRKHFPELIALVTMKEFIQVKNHINAELATKTFHEHTPSKTT